MTRYLLAFLLSSVACAQVKLANPAFEQGELGAVPVGWHAPTSSEQGGFGVKLVDQGCRTGARCVMMTGSAGAPPNAFGNLMQTLPAAGYTLRHIRLRSAIRVEGVGTRAQMWLRLDRADKTSAFLENMTNRPVTSAEWKTVDIETDVPEDVTQMALGVILFGGGTAWADDFSLDILAEIHKDKIEAPRPITPQGLVNLTAFTKLYGYVRFFHPSSQAAATDWETFAVEGIRTVEDAHNSDELIDRLRTIFAPIAPNVAVFPSGKTPPSQVLQTGPDLIRYRYNGVGLPSAAIPQSPYNTTRVRIPSEGAAVRKPFQAEVVPGVTVSVPLDLYADESGTLPHRQKSGPDANVLYVRSPAVRASRLAAVAIAWNVMQHFYPYFDVVKTDWSAELPKALRSAATDAGVDEFHATLRRLVAALKDGHGYVNSPHGVPRLSPPITMDWVAGDFLVTRVQQDKAEGIAPGDKILKIDGKPIAEAAAATRALISGATEQWIRYRSASELSLCNPATNRMALEIEPYAALGTSKTVDLPCGQAKFKDMATYTEPRPEKIAELEPGILYVDLDRVTEADWVPLVARLEKAKGIIFDMRGYPGQPGIEALAHLTDNTIRSARWNIPAAALPDQLDSPFQESGWDVPPVKPYFSAHRVFLIDGRAISYAETVMGIVENYKLGEIVGEPTAGTNGNVNPFKLPGGYTITWTGMKVLKHDGSQHHGIGILPTVPASRTRQGVAEGKDEILLRGVAVVKAAGQ